MGFGGKVKSLKVKGGKIRGLGVGRESKAERHSGKWISFG
jgi:hypothetical protein